jgi:hypothetical protein
VDCVWRRTLYDLLTNRSAIEKLVDDTAGPVDAVRVVLALLVDYGWAGVLPRDAPVAATSQEPAESRLVKIEQWLAAPVFVDPTKIVAVRQGLWNQGQQRFATVLMTVVGAEICINAVVGDVTRMLFGHVEKQVR